MSLRWRRPVLHALLALLATPLAGGLLIAGRLATARRWTPAAAALAWTLGTTSAGFAIAFGLPVTVWTAASLVLALWLAAGLGLAVVEAWDHEAPAAETVLQPRVWAQIVTWTIATVIALIPWAFLLAGLLSRWGTDFFGKPSMAWQVVLMAIVFLAPMGAVVGLVRGLLRRPHRPGPPVLFGLANTAVLGAVMCALLLYGWLETELLGLESLDTTPMLTEAWFLVILGMLAGPILWLAHYLSEARGVRDFAGRWAAAGVAMFLFAVNADLLTSASPVARRVEAARSAAAVGDDEQAARAWAWVVARTPRIPKARTAIRTGARDALRAGRPDLARGLLASVDGDFSDEVSSVELGEIASRLSSSELDLGSTVEAPIRPVRRESYLDSNWSALLTAVLTVRPELREPQLKGQLRDVSLSVGTIELMDLDPLLELRLVAGVFGCRVLAIPFDRHLEALEAGYPVLFYSDSSYYWKLLYWSAPGADAVQWLDYGRWGDTDEELDRASRRDLLGVESDRDSQDRRILAAVGRLGSRSRLAERLEREGGWAFMLVDSVDAQGLLRSFPGATQRVRELADVEAARTLFDLRAFRYARRMASGLPPGKARDELLAASWLDSESRSALEGDLGPEAREAARAGLAVGRLRSSSGWFLEHLLTLSESELACGHRREVLEEMMEIRPWSTHLHAERLAVAAGEADLERAASLALGLARQGEWSSGAILDALRELAPLEGVQEHAAGRAALETLSARLPLLAETEDGSVRRRTTLAPYCAARAALSKDAVRSAEWWRCAVDQEPLEASFRARLAGALRASGETWAAARELERSELLASTRSCETPVELAGSLTASGMGASGVGR